MKRPFILLTVVLLLGIATGIFLHKRRDIAPFIPRPFPVTSASTQPTAPMPIISPAPAVPPPPGVRADFVEFLSHESVTLDSPHVNEPDAEARAQNEANHMGPLEIQFTRDTVLSGKGAANQRILALYLLTLAGAKSNAALRDIALSPLPEGRFEPHTFEEQHLMQEKAQRVTAIDALLERAQKDAAARADLDRLAQEIRDPGLQSYLQKKLRTPPTM